MKIIPRPVHALLDYSWSAAIAAAPKVLGFEDEPKAKILCKGMASLTTAGSLVTRYELGALKILPFKAHLAVDGLGALLGIAAPWILGFSENKKARNAVLAFFIVEAIVVALSQPKEME